MLFGENMTLREYLKLNDMQVQQFATTLKYNKAYLSQIMCGTKSASEKLKQAVEYATGGLVKAENAFVPTQKIGLMQKEEDVIQKI